MYSFVLSVNDALTKGKFFVHCIIIRFGLNLHFTILKEEMRIIEKIISDIESCIQTNTFKKF
jgi:hypothetical protein